MKLAAYIGGLLGLGLLIFLVVRADLPAMLQTFVVGGWRLLCLIPYRALYLFLYALGWLYLLRPYDTQRRARLGYLFWVTTVREAVDRVLPVASIGGGVAGVRLLRWRGIAAAPAGATVIVEILLTLIVMYVFTALGLLLLVDLNAAGLQYRRFILVFVLSLPVPALTVLALRYGSIFERFHDMLRPLVGPIAVSEGGAALDRELRACLHRSWTLIGAGSLQFVAVISGSFEVWFALRLFGQPIGVGGALMLESLTQALRHLAFVVPAGLGVQEAGLILFGHALGISSELALAVSMAKRLRELLCGVPALISWQWMEVRRLRRPLGGTALVVWALLLAGIAATAATSARADEQAVDAAPGPGAPPPAPEPLPEAPSRPAASGGRSFGWLTTLPFLPIPEIGVDPNSGTTLGILPVWLHNNSEGQITRIIAPDAFYNPYFGYGAHARIFEYPSQDEIWSIVAGIEQRVQRGVDGEFETGLLREQLWSLNASLIYDRNGTPRFYGVGNESPAIAETDYTEQQELVQWQIGLNFNRAWQLQYSPLIRSVDVLPGTLAGIASLQSRFAHILGEGTINEVRQRISLIYDTRDSLFIPTSGLMLVEYGGLASRQGVFNDSLYTEAGFDGRGYWRVLPNTILAAHMALRYLPETHDLPFWALSGIGGGESEIGGEQILRGFGAGRFYDRDSFTTNIEMRNRVASFNTFSTQVDLEVTPFVDLARVFARPSTIPLSQLHTVGGIGFRGVTRPSVVGRVDIGYGSEGLAVFTGLNYPF